MAMTDEELLNLVKEWIDLAHKQKHIKFQCDSPIGLLVREDLLALEYQAMNRRCWDIKRIIFREACLEA